MSSGVSIREELAKGAPAHADNEHKQADQGTDNDRQNAPQINEHAKNDVSDEATDDQQVALTTNDDLKEWLNEAQQFLSSCKMASAERLLCKIVTNARELPGKNREIYVKALNDLAEVYSRKAKKARYNTMEARWWLIASLTLLKEGINDSKSVENKSEELDDLIDAARNAFRCIDIELLASLYKTAVMKNKSISSEVKKVLPGEETGDAQGAKGSPPELTWVQNLMTYCNNKLENESPEEPIDDSDSDVSETCDVPTDEPEEAEWTPPEESSSRAPRSRPRSVILHQDSITCDDANIQPCRSSSSLRRAFSFRTSKRCTGIARTHSFRDFKTSSTESRVSGEEKRSSVPSLLPDDAEDHKKRLAQLRDKYRKDRLSSSSSIQEEADQTIPPITGNAVTVTIAFAISRLADMLLQKKEMMQALFLYIRSFNIFRTVQANSVSEKHVATMLKNMARIKRDQGDPIGAIGFMERVLVKYKKIYGDDHIEVIDTLFQLGDLYMSKRWHGETVMDNMITIVHNEINKDFLTDQVDFETGLCDYDSDNASTVGSVDDLDLSDEESRHSGSYSVYAKEASGFYSKVVETIEKGDVQDEDNFLLKSTIKLGDCCFMNNEYDEAIKYYEKSMELIKVQSSVDLVHHAHVLNMIGVVNFIQKKYGMAAAMFGASNVLNQSLLGLNSSNFEVACIYSLWGITYWILNDMQKVLSPCILAHEIFTRLFVNRQHLLPMKRKWLVGQITFILGCSFRELRVFPKAMDYLKVCLTNAESSLQQNVSWIIRILLALGKCYLMQEDYETALNSYYYHSLDIIQQSRFITPGLEQLRIEILEVVASIHFQNQSWEFYIENAEALLDYYAYDSPKHYRVIAQTLEKLAALYMSRGEVDKSVSYYKEAVDTFKEHHGYIPSEMGPTIAQLALTYQCQSCNVKNEKDKDQLIEMAEKQFEKAFRLDRSNYSAILFLNFLCYCHRYADAIAVVEKLEYLTGSGPEDIQLNDYMMCAWPEFVEMEYKMYPEQRIPISSMGFYLATLCYVNMNEIVFAHAYAERLVQESSKELENPSIRSSIAAFGQLLICDYKQAASIFGYLYTSRHNPTYLTALWSCCSHEIEFTRSILCHHLLHYIYMKTGMLAEEEGFDTSQDVDWDSMDENKNKKMETLTDRTSNSDSSSHEALDDTVVNSGDEKDEEEWTVFEEYTVDETLPEYIKEIRVFQPNHIDNRQLDHSWARTPSDYTESREWDTTGVHIADVAHLKMLRGRDDEVPTAFTQGELPDSGTESQRSSIFTSATDEHEDEEEEWVVFDDYTEEYTVPQLYL